MKRNSTASYGQDNNGREQRKKRAIRYKKEDRYLKYEIIRNEDIIWSKEEKHYDTQFKKQE
jgi:hypothetical protein